MEFITFGLSQSYSTPLSCPTWLWNCHLSWVGALQCFMSMQNHKINSDILKHTRISLSSWSRCLPMLWVGSLSSMRHVNYAWNYMLSISMDVSISILPFSLNRCLPNSFLCLLAWIYLTKPFLKFFLARNICRWSQKSHKTVK